MLLSSFAQFQRLVMKVSSQPGQDEVLQWIILAQKSVIHAENKVAEMEEEVGTLIISPWPLAA